MANEITIKLSPAAAEWLATSEILNGWGGLAEEVQRKAAASVALGRMLERKRSLGLPWGPYPESCNPAINDKWKVCSSRPTQDGSHCTERMLGMLTEGQARLAAAAPELADALEASTELIEWVRTMCKSAFDDRTADADLRLQQNEQLLRESRWIHD